MAEDRATFTSTCPICGREWTRTLMITEKRLESIRNGDSTLIHFMRRALCTDCRTRRNNILNARITTYMGDKK